MKTVNSLSGGATSSYMAVHYPADYNIFSCITIDYPEATPKDKGFLAEIRKKIPGFIATAEPDATLRLMLDLEQKIGKEIAWVEGSYSEIIAEESLLPTMFRRHCTIQGKIYKIFEHTFLRWFDSIDDCVKMNIGIRIDEVERKWNIIKNNEGFKYPLSTKYFGENYRNWEELDWREVAFPLIDDLVTKADVRSYWKAEGWEFPTFSNCVGCFHKDPEVLRQQWDLEPIKMQWFADQEKLGKGTFRSDGTYEQFKFIPLPLFPVEQTQFNCHCTD